MKKDFVGNELKVGDEVVFIRPEKRDLLKGVVKSLGDKMVVITYEKKTNYYDRNYKLISDTREAKTNQYYERVVKIMNNTEDKAVKRNSISGMHFSWDEPIPNLK